MGFKWKEEREYASITGGVISILMIFFFFRIFTNTGINTLNKNYIVSSTNRKVYEDPAYLALSSLNSFYFTLGLSGIKGLPQVLPVGQELLPFHINTGINCQLVHLLVRDLNGLKPAPYLKKMNISGGVVNLNAQIFPYYVVSN